jgi:hypothetical protein
MPLGDARDGAVRVRAMSRAAFDAGAVTNSFCQRGDP